MVLLLIAANPSGARASEPIESNPFTRPGYTADRPLPTFDQQPEAIKPLELKATLIAGRDVLANVSGEILAPGEEIQGHRLYRVTEGQAVLIKEGNAVTLHVRDEAKEHARD